MTQKQRLMSIFKQPKKDLGVMFRYTLQDPKGLTQEFEYRYKNLFKHIKWLFNHKMDDNLYITIKGCKYRLVGAEMVEQEIYEFSDFSRLLGKKK